ncbi:MAG TPA: hypothetical protein VIJ18_06815 [Microbacteriaceae bacterium]
MYYDREGMNTPPRDTLLWRYMDLAKYLSLLHHSALYFSRKSGLENLDPWESYLGQAVAVNDGQFWERWQRLPYVNSWHVAANESAAMWQVYRGRGFGVAIRTTWDHLAESFIEDEEIVWGGAVRYVDYEVEAPNFLNAYNPLFMKRKAFEFEHEARLLVQSTDDDGPAGREIHVDIPTLIQEVVVSPYEPSWVAELISEVTSDRWPTVPIAQSQLLQPPPSAA